MCAHKNRRGIAEKVEHLCAIAGVKGGVKPYSCGIRCGVIKKKALPNSLYTIKKSVHAGIDQNVVDTIVIPSQKRLNIPAKNSVLPIV